MEPVVDGLRQGYAERVDFMLYSELDKDSAASGFASGQGISVVPTTVLVARDGTEIKRWIGARTDNEFRAELEGALSSPAQ